MVERWLSLARAVVADTFPFLVLCPWQVAGHALPVFVAPFPLVAILEWPAPNLEEE